MSLGDKTDCNLSFDKAVIDRGVLIHSLNNQYFSLLSQIQSLCSEQTMNTILYNKYHIYDTSSFVSTGNRSLNMLVEQLGKTAELLHTIKESVTRAEIVWKD